MVYSYIITRDRERIVDNLMEHGEFSNGSIKGKELSLDHPLANEMVDTLKLVPQGMANTYYTLHHLKQQDWDVTHENGYENSLIASFSLNGNLSSLLDKVKSGEGFKVETNTFQEFIESNQGIDLIVDFQNTITQSDCWTPQGKLNNPLISNFTVDMERLSEWPGMLEALNNLGIDSTNLENAISENGLESALELCKRPEVLLAYQYSQGRFADLPKKNLPGARFIQNLDLVEIAEEYLKFTTAQKLEGVEPDFKQFLLEQGESLNDKIDSAVKSQVLSFMNEMQLDDSKESIELLDETATTLYKQLDPRNELMGLRYHLEQLLDVYTKESEVDHEALSLQLNLQLDEYSERDAFNTWLLNNILECKLEPSVELKSKHEAMAFLENSNNVTIPQMMAALVHLSNQDLSKIQATLDGELVGPTNHTSEYYADLIKKFEGIVSQLSVDQGIDVSKAKEDVFSRIVESLSLNKPVSQEALSDSLSNELYQLAEATRFSPIGSEKADPIQKLTIKDVRAIILPEAVTEPEIIDQMLAIEKLREEGFKGKTILYSELERDGKAQAVHSFIKHNPDTLRTIGAAPTSQVDPELDIPKSIKILEEIQANHPYLKIRVHETIDSMNFLSNDLKSYSSTLAGVAHNGEMHVNLQSEHNAYESGLRKTIAHEAVHLGFKKMFTNSEYVDLMETVWQNISTEDKATIKQNYGHLDENKPLDRRSLAEEWLAMKAESIDLRDIDRIQPVIKVSLVNKLQGFRDSVLKKLGKVTETSLNVDELLVNAIKKAGEFNQFIDGKVIDQGLVVRKTGYVEHEHQSFDLYRGYKANLDAGRNLSTEVQIAAKQDFIHKYSNNGHIKLLNITFDNNNEPKLEGSQLSLPYSANPKDLLEILRQVEVSSWTGKPSLHSNISTEIEAVDRAEATPPAVVKAKLGNIVNEFTIDTSVNNEILNKLSGPVKDKCKQVDEKVKQEVDTDMNLGIGF
ncbi:MULTISPECIES: hypothetical protein [unclassified Vibrio]|uniref:hypothetical protein n=1 Tax=unclassified Vibrio TaxID=2614977 RepID=UPI001E4BC583|nr:hypothetical protein [Vibrio sp. MA64]MCC9652116.1 hypothetical protein [Vibrio sp. MA64]